MKCIPEFSHIGIVGNLGQRQFEKRDEQVPQTSTSEKTKQNWWTDDFQSTKVEWNQVAVSLKLKLNNSKSLPPSN